MDAIERDYLNSQGFDPEDYKVVVWADSQDYIGYTEEDGVYLINDEEGYELYGSSAYVVPKDLEPIEDYNNY